MSAISPVLGVRAQGVLLLLAACILFGTIEMEAHAQAARAVTWVSIQSDASNAFALYADEAATPLAQRPPIRFKRMTAFDHLQRDLLFFVRTNYSEQERRTASYVFAMFTLALYTELSGDLWLAQARYVQVEELLQEGLRPAGTSVPKYNGVRIDTLTARQLDTLRTAIADLGPRPTHVSIEQSVDDPNVTDFLNRINSHSNSAAVRYAAGARDQRPAFAYYAAVERHEKSASKADLGLRVVEDVARSAGVDVRVHEWHGVRAVWIGGEGLRTADALRHLEAVAADYERIYGRKGLLEKSDLFVLRGEMTDSQNAFFTAAFANNEPVAREGLFRHRGLRIVVAPGVERDTEELLAAIDYPLLYAGMLARNEGRLVAWYHFAFLSNQGSGDLSTARFARLFAAVQAQASQQVKILPTYECPGTKPAIRFCVLHAGLFARWLDSQPAAGSSAQTALVTLARMKPPITADEHVSALESVLRMRQTEIESAFSAYIVSLSAGDSSAIDARMVTQLVQAFSGTTPVERADSQEVERLIREAEAEGARTGSEGPP